MVKNIWNWINERVPLKTMLQLGLDEEIPGGASFFFTLGSATLFVFILQMVTGVWQLFYYVPTIDHAYDSLNYLRLFVPYGWLIHGLHYWGASAMIVLVGLHMLRVFVWGAYKKPREMTWLIGVFLLLLTIGLSFTGAALPWDERGYWAAEVGTSIAGTFPIIGNSLKHLLIGGTTMGQLTISRFFILHTAILPGITIIIIAVHLIAFRKFGSVGPWTDEKRKFKSNFWPDQVFKDVIVVSLIFLILITLSAFSPPPFMGPADPLDTTFTPKPEWNFLFLYQALKFFSGSLEVIGTVGIPTVVILLFILIPFFDRKKDHNPLRRPFMMLGGAVFVILLLSLTVEGYSSKEKISKPNKKIKSNKPPAELTNSALKGEKVFNTYGCIACHSMNGKGGKIGPDLTNESSKNRTKDWIIDQIKNPKEHYPKSPMPSFTMLNKSQINNLADYLLSTHNSGSNSSDTNESGIKNDNSNNNSQSNSSASKTEKKNNFNTTGRASNIIGNVAHGSLLYQQDCQSCHGENGNGGVQNPGSLSGFVPKLNPISKNLYSKNPQSFADSIDKYIQHGAIPAGTNPALHMFDYGDSHTLTQQEISNIEAYILNLNGVNRARINVSSFSPKQYFTIVIIMFIVLFIVLLIIYNIKNSMQARE